MLLFGQKNKSSVPKIMFSLYPQQPFAIFNTDKSHQNQPTFLHDYAFIQKIFISLQRAIQLYSKRKEAEINKTI